MSNIAVLGAGSWGSALAILLARNGHNVRLWAHNPVHIHALINHRENQRYLPGFIFPDNLVPHADLIVALKNAELVLIVVPSSAFTEVLDRLQPIIHKLPIMWAIKGFEPYSTRLLSDVFTEKIGQHHPYAILAGPSFAREVANGLPTAVTIASNDKYDINLFASPFHGSNFFCYTSQDTIGVQVGGAIKNVIAIATGISDSIGCGANTRAALITRGLHEITRLAVALGAQERTLSGLAGLGDLLLTATDNQSRNRQFGIALGQNKNITDIKAEIGQVIEGETAAHETWQLANRLQVRMPIVEHVHKILTGELSIYNAFTNLTNRVLKNELP